MTTGHLFARNVAVSKYDCGVEKKGTCVVNGDIDEYVSDPPIPQSPTRPAVVKSLALAVEEPPLSVWKEGDPSQWVAPAYTLAQANGGADASDAIGDGGRAVQGRRRLP